jgi:hypothetical protein
MSQKRDERREQKTERREKRETKTAEGQWGGVLYHSQQTAPKNTGITGRREKREERREDEREKREERREKREEKTKGRREKREESIGLWAGGSPRRS